MKSEQIAQKYDATGSLVLVMRTPKGRKKAFSVRRFNSGNDMEDAIRAWEDSETA